MKEVLSLNASMKYFRCEKNNVAILVDTMARVSKYPPVRVCAENFQHWTFIPKMR